MFDENPRTLDQVKIILRRGYTVASYEVECLRAYRQYTQAVAAE